MHRIGRITRTATGIVVAASFVLPSTALAANQSDATPSAVSCEIAPLPTPIWDGIELPEPTAPVSVAGPFVPPTGQPVDDTTLTGVTATIAEAVACQNAGDVARTLALFTPDALRGFFSGPRGFDGNSVDATVAAGPQPVDEERATQLDAIENVVQLNDGRVGATVTTSVGGQTYTDFLFLADGTTPDGQNRWLIDSSVAIDSQTQVEGGATEIP